MYYRWKIVDGDTTTFSEWKEENPVLAVALAERINEVRAIRKAQYNSAISIEESPTQPVTQ